MTMGLEWPRALPLRSSSKDLRLECLADVVILGLYPLINLYFPIHHVQGQNFR